MSDTDPTEQFGPHIQFTSQQEREFFAQAMIGIEVREFLTSETGRLLHGYANQKIAECTEKIFEIDPYTPEGKRAYEKLKFDKMCADMFMRWCAEAIIEGNNAESQLRNEDDY